MSIAETLADHYQAVSSVKERAAAVAHGAFVQANIAKTETRNAEGKRTTDVIRLGFARVIGGMAEDVFVTARTYQREVVGPARGIASSLSGFQESYGEFIVNKNPASLKKVNDSLDRVRVTVDHFSIHKPRKLGVTVAENLPQILSVAEEAVRSRKALEEQRRRLASMKSEPSVITATDTRSGQVVEINKKDIITAQAKEPSVREALLSLLRF